MREPKALKIEATCTPVAPTPMTSSDGGTEKRFHASLCVAVKSKPGTGSGRELPPVQMMTLSARSRGAWSLNGVGVREPRQAGLLVDPHARPFNVVAQQRLLACGGGHLADTRQQPRVIQRGFAGRDPVARQLPGLPDQPRCLGEGAHRHRPVVSGHPAELIASDQRGPGSQAGRAERRDHTGRSCAHDHDVKWLGRRWIIARSSGVSVASVITPCRVRWPWLPGVTIRTCAQ
jgi:hypothetical protein